MKRITEVLEERQFGWLQDICTEWETAELYWKWMKLEYMDT